MEIDRIADQIETVSQRYAARWDINRDADWFLLKLQEEVGELTQCYLSLTGQARPRGKSPDELAAAFRAELADVFCHVLLLARHHNVDLPAEIQAKWLDRRTRD